MKSTCEPCPLCGQKMRLREGAYSLFWRCTGHPRCPTTRRARDDGSPVGPFNTADAATRQWRQQAHAVFDPLWQGGRMSRIAAYAWLARTMRLPVQEQMSRTTKEGKRGPRFMGLKQDSSLAVHAFGHIRQGGETLGVDDAIHKRHSWGRTERIRRRNRRTFVRLGNKRRRADGKRSIREER